MYLGIDVGTSSVKAVLVDEAGGVVDQASAPLPISRPHAGWSKRMHHLITTKALPRLHLAFSGKRSGCSIVSIPRSISRSGQ